jgi:hypothetical protein
MWLGIAADSRGAEDGIHELWVRHELALYDSDLWLAARDRRRQYLNGLRWRVAVLYDASKGTFSGLRGQDPEAVGPYPGPDLSSSLDANACINKTCDRLTLLSTLVVKWQGEKRFRVEIRTTVTMEDPDGDGSYEPELANTIVNPYPDEYHALDNIGGSIDTLDVFVHTAVRTEETQWKTLTIEDAPPKSREPRGEAPRRASPPSVPGANPS